MRGRRPSSRRGRSCARPQSAHAGGEEATEHTPDRYQEHEEDRAHERKRGQRRLATKRRLERAGRDHRVRRALPLAGLGEPRERGDLIGNPGRGRRWVDPAPRDAHDVRSDEHPAHFPVLRIVMEPGERVTRARIEEQPTRPCGVVGRDHQVGERRVRRGRQRGEAESSRAVRLTEPRPMAILVPVRHARFTSRTPPRRAYIASSARPRKSPWYSRRFGMKLRPVTPSGANPASSAAVRLIANAIAASTNTNSVQSIEPPPTARRTSGSTGSTAIRATGMPKTTPNAKRASATCSTT